MNKFQKTAATATAAVVLAGTATVASAGCFGMEHNNDFSVKTNAQLAGLSAIKGHSLNARTKRWDNVQRLQEFDFSLSNGTTLTVSGSLSGHSFAAAVRQCEDFQGTEKTYRDGLFGGGNVIDTVTHDYMALTCDGDDAYVLTPTGDLFVVTSGSVAPRGSGQLRCDR